MEELALREVSSLSLEQKASPVDIAESGLVAEVDEYVHTGHVGGWEVLVVSDWWYVLAGCGVSLEVVSEVWEGDDESAEGQPSH